MNWFERHLNWTMVLGIVGAYLVFFIAVFTIALFDLSVSEVALSVIGLIITLAILIPVWGWALRKKNRSLWWLLLGLFVPFGFIVLFCLGNKSLTRDASGNSIADYNKAIELNPNHADAYYKRGDAYDEMGEYGKALADYGKAIGLNPNDALAYCNRGCAYGEIGEYEKAIADYNKAIELNPNDALAYYNRGLVYHEKGEVPKAVSDLEKCIGLSTDPELTEDAQHALSEIKHSP
jgi:tetratricopeptide (TPR) repeat protein